LGAGAALKFVEWQGRREARAELRRGVAPGQPQVFRGFIQINLVRPR